MRTTTVGLFLVVASFVAIGCADVNDSDANVDSTSSEMELGYIAPWREPPIKLVPLPPPPVVFQSISGYAGFPNMAGHSDGPSQSTFVRPTHIASNGDGTTWVVDEDPNDRYLGYIRVIQDTRGGVLGPHVFTPFSLYELGFGPWNLGGIVVAPNGIDAFVSDINGHAIHKVRIGQGRTHFTGGIIGFLERFAGGHVDGPPNVARFMSPSGLARDAAGNIFVCDTGNHAIRKIDPSGNVSTVAVGGSISPSFLPKTLAVAPNGTVYAVSGQAVYRVTPGQVTLLAGSPASTGFVNGDGSGALFNQPKGIAVDRLGDVYVADSENHVIRKISVAGNQVSTLAGLPSFDPHRGFFDTYGPDDTVLDAPWGLSFWGDRLVFSDADRLTVRTMNPAAPQ